MIDPVFVDNSNNSGGSDSGGSGGGGSGSGGNSQEPTAPEPTTPEPTPEEPDTVELTMKVTAAEVNEYLKTKNVVLKPGANPADNTLDIDVNVTVPADKTLTMESGVDMDVQTG